MNELYRKTPVMGWASWNCFRTDINEQKIKEQIDAMIYTGLADCGYIYANMDDGFFGGRSKDGTLQIHKKRFPNGIKVIADYAHSKKLKAGIYTDGGDMTCGYYYDNEGENGANAGLYSYEEQDLKMYLEDWDFDFIKVDWCGGLRLGLDEQKQYSKIGSIIDNIRIRNNKCIEYNICRWHFPGTWATDIANSWRTGADISPNFKSVINQIDNLKRLSKYCKPGHVNDPDMMQIGNGLSIEEERTHFTMWCMLSAPLMIGCDLTKINNDTLEILKNKELIEINQDKACLQAYVSKDFIGNNGDIIGEVWIKDLGKKQSNKKAVAFLNRSENIIKMPINFSEIGLGGKILNIRDLLNHNNISEQDIQTLCVNPHEAPVFIIESEYAVAIKDKYFIDDDLQLKPIKRIDEKYAEQLIKNGAYLIDVKEKSEYEKHHLNGAINIPYTEIHARINEFFKDKQTNIIVYCRTGKRSAQAKSTLEYLGYENVHYLGGIEISKNK